MSREMTREMSTGNTPDVTHGNGSEATRAEPVFRPETDIFETENHVVVVADMPGVAPDSVDITLERRVLTIRGHVDATPPEGYRQIYAEYGVGGFERVFTLSETIDQDRIEASQRDGVLMLKLPKAEAHKPKRIAVKSA